MNETKKLHACFCIIKKGYNEVEGQSIFQISSLGEEWEYWISEGLIFIDDRTILCYGLNRIKSVIARIGDSSIHHDLVADYCEDIHLKSIGLAI